MKFQNSNLKLLFRKVYQYYWENNLSCQSSHNVLSTKNSGLLFHSAFRNTSVHVFQLLVADIVHLTYYWYCVLEVWVWGMSNNCGAIIAWVLGIMETSVESMYLTLQFLFLFQFRLWWWTLLICMHRPYTIIYLFWSIQRVTWSIFPYSKVFNFCRFARIVFGLASATTIVFGMVNWLIP